MLSILYITFFFLTHEGCIKLNLSGVNKVLLAGNGGEVDDDDVLNALSVENVLILTSQDDTFHPNSVDGSARSVSQQGTSKKDVSINCICFFTTFNVF